MRTGLVSVPAVRGLVHKLTYPLRRWPRLSKLAIGGAVALVLLVALENVYVLLSGGDSTDEVADVPRAEVAIVPSDLVIPNGGMSAILAVRDKQAPDLWRAGKVKMILVSFLLGPFRYYEPDTM